MRALRLSCLHAACVLVLTMLIAGCSDDDADSPTPSPTTAASASATASTPTPTASPTLPHAPQGRSGVAALDALIEVLLRGQADELASQFTVSARQNCSSASPTATPAPRVTMPASEWTSRFASASRSLYAVFRGQENEVPRAEFQVVFSVSAADAPTGWRFYVDGDRVIDVVAGCDGPPSVYAPSVVGAYDRFVILPSREELPKPPPGHPLSMRSGVREVDAILEVLERRDLASLNALVSLQEYPCEAQGEAVLRCAAGASATTPVRGFPELTCSAHLARLSERAFLDWATRPGATLHAVAVVPSGHAPESDHTIIVITPVRPFKWESNGLLIRAGRVVGAIDGCDIPDGMYPPLKYVVPQPLLGQPAPPGRRAGVAVLDAIIDAMRSQSVTALMALTDFDHVGCVAEQTGIGAPPLCRAGEVTGTTVEAITSAQCEGSQLRRDELMSAYGRLLQQQREVFAVTDRGEGETRYSFGRGRYELVFEGKADAGDTSERQFTRNIALIATEQGVTLLRFGCGPGSATELISPGRAPMFVIAPPVSIAR
jgi:hypothetical protein